MIKRLNDKLSDSSLLVCTIYIMLYIFIHQSNGSTAEKSCFVRASSLSFSWFSFCCQIVPAVNLPCSTGMQ